MIGDWPGFYGLYQKRETCTVFDQFDVTVYPAGPAGIRKSYAGGHTFAIPKAAPRSRRWAGSGEVSHQPRSSMA